MARLIVLDHAGATVAVFADDDPREAPIDLDGHDLREAVAEARTRSETTAAPVPMTWTVLLLDEHGRQREEVYRGPREHQARIVFATAIVDGNRGARLGNDRPVRGSQAFISECPAARSDPRDKATAAECIALAPRR